MIAPWFVCGLGLLITAQEPEPRPDVSALIDALGAARYADRQKAAAELLERGREVIPPLRAIRRESRDPEVRQHAETLLDLIESRVLIEPTMVRIEARGEPLSVVVKALAAQSGFPLSLTPEQSPLWQSRTVTLAFERPLPFWTALDRLCEAAGLHYQHSLDGNFMGRGHQLRLFQGAVPSAPRSDSGPFRATLVSIHHHRDKYLAARPATGVVVNGGVNSNLLGPNSPGLTETFYAMMQILAEPRLMIAQDGPVVVTAAVDDRGTSMVASNTQNANQNPTWVNSRFAGYAGFTQGMGGPTLQVQIPLRYPERAGATIKSLCGTLPVSVAARRPEPVAIELAGAAGKSVRTAEMLLQVHEWRVDPNLGQVLELSIQPVDDPGETAGPRPPGLLNYRSPDSFRSQIEIVDAQGRALQWYPRSSQVQADLIRMMINVMPTEGAAPPAVLRLYELCRAKTELRFEFADVPMPAP